MYIVQQQIPNGCQVSLLFYRPQYYILSHLLVIMGSQYQISHVISDKLVNINCSQAYD